MIPKPKNKLMNKLYEPPMRNFEKIIFNNAGLKILLFFSTTKDDYSNIAKASRSLQITFATVHDYVDFFEKEGLIETKKVGRNRNVRLTNRGLQYTFLLLKLFEV